MATTKQLRAEQLRLAAIDGAPEAARGRVDAPRLALDRARGFGGSLGALCAVV